MKELTTPKNTTAEVLYTLIKKGSVSIMDFPYMSGFRTRISELSKLIALKKDRISKKNKYGNTYIYVNHILMDKKHAKKLYEKINE